MKNPIAFAVLALAATPVLAATDLSRPGALERLRSEQPRHYEAVLDVARIGQTATCTEEEVERVKKGHGLDKLDCGFVNSTTNPPSRRVRFEVDGTSYVITVRLSDTAPRLIGR